MRLQAFVIYLVITIVTGCSGITVSQDFDQDADFATLGTFAWKLDPEAKHDNDTDMSPLVATRVRNAIKAQLIF